MLVPLPLLSPLSASDPARPRDSELLRPRNAWDRFCRTNHCLCRSLACSTVVKKRPMWLINISMSPVVPSPPSKSPPPPAAPVPVPPPAPRPASPNSVASCIPLAGGRCATLLTSEKHSSTTRVLSAPTAASNKRCIATASFPRQSSSLARCSSIAASVTFLANSFSSIAAAAASLACSFLAASNLTSKLLASACIAVRLPLRRSAAPPWRRPSPLPCER